MEPDPPASDLTEPSAMGADPIGESSGEVQSGPPDPAALVERLIEAGEWPDPALLDQIVAAGEAVLEPLLAFMRTYPHPRDYERENVLYNGIGILSKLRSPATIPDLVEIIRRYPEDSGELAAEVLGDFGAVAFEPALVLITDPTVTGYSRHNAIGAARRAAGDDPALRARLVEVLRPLLADALERTREEARKDDAESDQEDGDDEPESEGWVLEDLDDDDSFEDEDEDDGLPDDEDLEASSDETASSPAVEDTEDEAGRELLPHEDLMFLITGLAGLADPESRGLIRAAFEEDLVETFWVNEKAIEATYREGGEKTPPPRDWLENYRERHESHIAYLNRPPALSPARAPAPSRYAIPEVAPEPPPPPVQTIRNTGPKVGRNDPCWCGSGKKYKKCHLGKDESK